MRFKGLDLNLLVAFDALMNTRSITRAAVLMNMSQPAMSAALARMRGYFQDELLVAQGYVGQSSDVLAHSAQLA